VLCYLQCGHETKRTGVDRNGSDPNGLEQTEKNGIPLESESEKSESAFLCPHIKNHPSHGHFCLIPLQENSLTFWLIFAFSAQPLPDRRGSEANFGILNPFSAFLKTETGEKLHRKIANVTKYDRDREPRTGPDRPRQPGDRIDRAGGGLPRD